MHTPTKLIPGAVIAMITLALVVSSAPAQRLQSSSQSIRVTFPELTIGDNGATREIICPVTLEGTFHSRTIAKEPERLIGYITRAILNEPRCRRNEIEGATLLTATLPWHLRYESFAGTLPNITRVSMRLILYSGVLQAFGVACLYKATAASPVRAFVDRTVGGATNSLTAYEETLIPRFEGSTLFCPASGRFRGSSAIRILGSSTTLVLISLI